MKKTNVISILLHNYLLQSGPIKVNVMHAITPPMLIIIPI